MTRFYTLGIVLLSCLAFSQSLMSQNVVQIDASAYDSLKQNNAIDPNITYVINSVALPPAPVGGGGGGFGGGGGGGIVPLSFQGYIPHDDTYTLAMAPNDDGSSGVINLPFDFCFYGTTYNQVYINNNGNITLNGPYGAYTAQGFPLNGTPMLAPFWGDVDTRGGGAVYYKLTPTALYVNWVNVGYYSMQNDKVNTFMIVITDSYDPVLSLGNNVGLGYVDMQWTTGAASCGGAGSCSYNGNNYTCGGNGGFCGTPTTVGTNKGDGTTSHLVGRFDHPGMDFNGPMNPSGVDWLDNKAIEFNICNLPPICLNCPGAGGGGIGGGGGGGGIVGLCQGSTQVYSYTFDAPEPNQTTSITVDGSQCPGYTFISHTQNGTTATVTFSVTAPPGASGSFPITMTAVDDYMPAGVTVVTIDVTLVPAPTPVITGQSSYCMGSTATISAPAGYTSYLWNPGGQNTQSVNVTAGTYTVTVDSLGCQATSAPFTVTENPLPLAVITGAPVYCVGGSTTLTATPNGMTTYAWSNGQNTQSIVVNQPINLTVTVTDPNGCVGTSAAVNVVQGNPSVTITGIQPFCQNDLLTLTAVGQNVSIYTWHDGSTSQTYQTPGGQAYVTVTDIYGCIASDTVYTTPDVLPVAVFSATSVCQNEFNDFTEASTSQSSNIVQWAWNFGDGSGTSNLQNPSYQYASFGTYQASLTVTTQNGCTNTLTQNVVVYPLPTANISSPNHFGCVPINVTFNDQSVITSGAVVGWQWNFGNGSYSNLQNPSSVYNQVDSFTVELIVTSNFGCVDTAIFVDYVETYPYPTAFFTYSPTNISMSDPTANFNDESIGSIDWVWSFGDGNSSTLQFPSNTYDAPGTYLVEQTVSNIYGCVSTYSEEIIIDNGYQVFIPAAFSPNDDGLNDLFIIQGSFIATYELFIFDRWGKIITSGANIGWDGKISGAPAKEDVYVYKVRAYDIVGTEYNYNGNISLIR